MVICPIITYGAIVWWSRTRLKSAQTCLDRLQRMVCVALSGCIRTTPTASLEGLLGLLPLHLRVEAEALSCMKRFMCLGLWKDYSKYLSWGLLTSRLSGLPSFVMPSDSMALCYAFQKPYEVLFPTREDWLKSPSWLKGNCSVWYTDGSRLNLHSGAGVCCPRDDTRLSFPLGKFATVFQAEVFVLSCVAGCVLIGATVTLLFVFVLIVKLLFFHCLIASLLRLWCGNVTGYFVTLLPQTELV